MKDRNRNKYVLFLFSLLPGAAEMYVGLMHMGISLLALFFAGLALAISIDTADMLMLVPVLIWFFGFFHAQNLLHSDDETFAAVKDEYVWNEFFGSELKLFSEDAPRKGVAAFLIVAGLGILWEAFVSTVLGVLQFNHSDYRVWEVANLLSVVPKAALSVVLIVCGRRLIREKKAVMEAKQRKAEEKDEAVTSASAEEKEKTVCEAGKTQVDSGVVEAAGAKTALEAAEVIPEAVDVVIPEADEIMGAVLPEAADAAAILDADETAAETVPETAETAAEEPDEES